MAIGDAINKAGKIGAQLGKKVGSTAWKAAGSSVGVGFGLNVIGNKLLGGDSWGKAATRAAGESVLQAVAPGVFWGLMAFDIAKTIPGAVLRGGEAAESRFNQARRNAAVPTFSYTDTQQAVTMRQAAVQAIQGSKLNARNALGGEAALMHNSYASVKGRRNYYGK